MESTLLIVTIASLALTIVMGVMLAVLLLESRRRSEARVVALADMAAAAEAYAVEPEPADEFELEPIAPIASIASTADLFAARQSPSAWPKRLALVAGIGGLVLAVALAGRALSGGEQPTTPAVRAGAGAEGPQSLELMSLSHEQTSNGLRITGLVQNPRDGSELTQVIATALLFSADGTFLASGRAPLDFTTLRPGDESGFVMTVPVSAPVARYRVGFRRGDGRIIGHVDRRLDGTIARGPS